MGGEDVLAGLMGDVSHLLERGFEAAAVGDPIAVEGGVLGGENPGDRLAGLLRGQLPVRAVAWLRVGAAAVGVVAGRVALDPRSLAGEPDVGEPGLPDSMRRREETRPVGPARAARSRRLGPTLPPSPIGLLMESPED